MLMRGLQPVPSVTRPIVLWGSLIHYEPVHLVRYAAMIVQCFDEDHLPSLLRERKAKVIVHHGVPIDADGYKRIYSHTETLPFFVNKDSGVESLNAGDAAAILSGKVDNWAEIGGKEMGIKLYGPQTMLKKQALSRIVGGSVENEFAGTGDYAFMAEKVNKTKGAVAVGLRSKHAVRSNLPKGTLVLPITDTKMLAYTMPIFVYVKENDEEARAAATTLFNLVSERAKEDGARYPLDDRLKEFEGGTR